MMDCCHERRTWAALDPPIRAATHGSFLFALAMAVVVMLCVPARLEAETLQQGLFVIHYEPRDESSARHAAETLSGAMDRFSANLPAGGKPIDVFICGTQDSFARYAGRYAQPKVGGVAKVDESIIAVKTRALVPGLFDFDGTLRHELVHILLARNYNVDELPRWLNEGIAMTLAREHRWGSTYRVAMMYLQGDIIPYQELTWVFLEPGREAEFGDAYAQSLLMTKYLMDRLGNDAFWQLLRDLDTMRFGQAMQHHLGMIPPDFLNAWVRSLWKIALIVSIVSGFGVFQLAALLVLVAYIRKRRRGQGVIRQWEEEEREDEKYGPVIFPWELETGETDGPWIDDEDDEQ